MISRSPPLRRRRDPVDVMRGRCLGTAGSHRTCISSPSSSRAGFEGGGGRASRVTWPGGEAPDQALNPAAFLARTRATTFRSTSRSSMVRAAQPLSSAFTLPASNQVSSPSYLYCTSKAAAGAANSDSVWSGREAYRVADPCRNRASEGTAQTGAIGLGGGSTASSRLYEDGCEGADHPAALWAEMRKAYKPPGRLRFSARYVHKDGGGMGASKSCPRFSSCRVDPHGW